MKKSLLLGASTAFAVILTACTGNGSVEQVEAVYGPPPTELRQHDDPMADVYGPPVEPWDMDSESEASNAAGEPKDGASDKNGYNASEGEDSDA